MKNLLFAIIAMLMITSCAQDTFRVIKYSDSNQQGGDYYSFISPKEEYYIAKSNDYYYVKTDTIIHFEKVSYLGRKDCFEETIVKDENGKKYLLNAYYDESTVEDEFVYIKITDLNSKEEAYSFVLDWKSRNKVSPAGRYLVSSN
ncbi:MAG: hypothetical protein KAG37_06560 [Flavobacteriales bacterium]|nr:hypothetical protein [Flavobacteriales bacterium]